MISFQEGHLWVLSLEAETLHTQSGCFQLGVNKANRLKHLFALAARTLLAQLAHIT